MISGWSAEHFLAPAPPASALVVHDVRADLADHRRIAVAVEVVVLDLEELAEQLADLVRLGVRRLVGDALNLIVTPP